jgi:hypothetical protein
MAINKLQRFDESSAGVTVPKDDLRLEGLVDENGEVEEGHQVHINYEGDGEWSLKLLDEP